MLLPSSSGGHKFPQAQGGGARKKNVLREHGVVP
jgi:hypothetical protein